MSSMNNLLHCRQLACRYAFSNLTIDGIKRSILSQCLLFNHIEYGLHIFLTVDCSIVFSNEKSDGIFYQFRIIFIWNMMFIWFRFIFVFDVRIVFVWLFYGFRMICVRCMIFEWLRTMCICVVGMICVWVYAMFIWFPYGVYMLYKLCVRWSYDFCMTSVRLLCFRMISYDVHMLCV